MMMSKLLFRKIDVLYMIFMLMAVALATPAASVAAEPLFSKARFSELLDGDVQLATLGHHAGLHMMFKSPTDSSDATSAPHADKHLGSGGSGVRLNVTMPWK
jgi:hypothetical protein